MDRFIGNLQLIANDFRPSEKQPYQIKQTQGDPKKDADAKSHHADLMSHKSGVPGQANVDKLESGSKDEDKKDEGDNDAKSSKKNSEASGARASQMVSKGGSNL